MRTIKILFAIAFVSFTVSCNKTGISQNAVAMSTKEKPAVLAIPKMDALEAY